MKNMISVIILFSMMLTFTSCILDDTNNFDDQEIKTETELETGLEIDVETTVEPEVELRTQGTTNAKSVLILYDDLASEVKAGKTNAMLLQNLLGHFDINIRAKSVQEYKKDEMDKDDTIFYLGTVYDVLNAYQEGTRERKAYEAFYTDVATKNKTIVWMNYNLPLFTKYWDEHSLGGTTFSAETGLKFNGVYRDKYNRVKYKNVELFKGVIPFQLPGANNSTCEYEGDNKYACSLELNVIDIVDSSKSHVYATSYSTMEGGNSTPSPYITKGNNFWFVGDIPFAYMSEEDRYLAFSDLLHDMLKIEHAESHKAIMRLEDVDSKTKISNLESIANVMREENIPFSVAVIAQYEDALGIEHNGTATTIKISDTQIGKKLKELYDEGLISVVQHGTTHQYHASLGDSEFQIKNPYNGLTGSDFEFLRVVEQEDLSLSYLYPIESDSSQWAKERINKGKDIFSQLGIKPFAWEAPHYMAGPNHYRGIREVYPVQYARLIYFTNEGDTDIEKRNKFIGQFFPYMIKKDLYGYTIIPENLQNIIHTPNPNFRKLLPEDTIRFAKKLKVVRDGVASFYYHPFLGTADLKEIISGLKAEGYQFVSAPSLLE